MHPPRRLSPARLARAHGAAHAPPGARVPGDRARARRGRGGRDGRGEAGMMGGEEWPKVAIVVVKWNGWRII